MPRKARPDSAERNASLTARRMTLGAFAARAVMLLMISGAAAAKPTCVATNGLAVDADGAPDSYRVDGNGLSYTCDGVFAIVKGVAQTHKNNKAHWQELCRSHWREAQRTGNYSKVKIVGFLRDASGPVVQGAGDPLPNEAYITTTSLTVPGTPAKSQRHFVNAREIPFVVGSSTFGTGEKVGLGDVVAVYRPLTKRLAFATYGDCCTLGEGSVRLHQDLGNNPFVTKADGIQRAKRGIADKVIFVAFPGVKTDATLDAGKWRAQINARGQAALQQWGGLSRIQKCAGNP